MAIPLFSASASVTAPASCPPDTYWTVTQVGSRYYQATGNTIGKYNSSAGNSTLALSESTTVAKATSFTATAKVGVGWGIAQIEASFSVQVTATVTRGTTITDTMNVDPHHYGRMTPKVEYTNYSLQQWRDNGNCKGSTLIDTEPTLQAITAWPFYSECQDTTNTCTPKP